MSFKQSSKRTKPVPGQRQPNAVVGFAGGRKGPELRHRWALGDLGTGCRVQGGGGGVGRAGWLGWEQAGRAARKRAELQSPVTRFCLISLSQGLSGQCRQPASPLGGL